MKKGLCSRRDGCGARFRPGMVRCTMLQIFEKDPFIKNIVERNGQKDKFSNQRDLYKILLILRLL